MKLLVLAPFLFLVSCTFFDQANTADYDKDGHISDEEYHRFNDEKEEQAREITKESMKRRERILETDS